MTNNALESTLARLDGVKDMMNIRRVYGDAYQVDGVTLIPVALVRGGGGGGGGEGTGDQNGTAGSGSGAGLGFGVNVRPVGVYVVRDGDVTWQPAVDVMRVIIGGQLLGLVAILTLRSIIRHRHRHTHRSLMPRGRARRGP
jgi:uncharacterized spore protein YtfJ